MNKAVEVIYQYFKKLDKPLFIVVTVLGALGVVMLYSIVANDASTIPVNSRLYITQCAALIMGAACALIISAMDYHKIVKLWFLYVPLCVILILLTFTDMGVLVESTGDRAWLRIGNLGTIQPSELLKIAFICTFSMHLAKVGDRINNFGNVCLLTLHGAAPVLLILIQGDDGTAFVFICIFLFMLFAAGISWKYILPVLVCSPVLAYVVWTKFMKQHQKMRFLVLFDEELDPLGYGYQQHYGKIALGSGKIFGKGLISDDFIAIPEAQNDFIFAYIGQAFGFIGCAAVIAALMFVILKIFADSRIAKDPLGKNICVGMFSLILVHCILNIGMVLGAMPVIGVPLPFLSQGGSSLLALNVGIGLVMSTYSHSEKTYRVFYDAE
ncbi:MAG: FtsW/RodA/SpoVE family cell cycle protein [Oscillospiraceae bacterium]|nr:FtsW/RodA/SpoVE family cell cycle protein [Oscillospiraceae bacterium]MDY2848543.1 FtsW/RodA/SpoVE family cell cycle protein [Oscillospiraceae bacterium]